MIELPVLIEEKIQRIPIAGCWVWIGASNSGRYGSISINRKPKLAHRVVWSIFNGQIPNGIEVMHICDNGFCVNPSHLKLGTHLENMNDMAIKGRAKSIAGDKHWTRLNPEKAAALLRKNTKNIQRNNDNNSNSKITHEIANLIKRDYSKGEISYEKLGMIYGLKKSAVGNVIKGKTWKE